MTKTEDRSADMIEKLKKRGFRITPQRHAIIKILAVSEGHPTAEQVYEKVREQFPTTSLATVYKTISLLKELNELLELGFPDGSNRYDGAKPFPHPHAICVKCQKIMDPEPEGFDDLKLEISQKTGYEILYHRLDFFGLCPECRRKK
jgi:Fur family transcriptional regulator, peroxide stress response regulator